MGKQLLKGGILGGILLFVWMMLSWMVIPWHCAFFKKFSDEQKVAAVISETVTESGIYLLPNGFACGEGEDHAAMRETMKRGPTLFASIRRHGFDVTSLKPYVASLIMQMVAAFFVTYLLLQTREIGYWSRVWFLTVFGIAAGLFAAFPDWNWWGYPFGYALVMFLDLVIGWFLTGLVLAAVVKRRYN